MLSKWSHIFHVCNCLLTFFRGACRQNSPGGCFCRSRSLWILWWRSNPWCTRFCGWNFSVNWMESFASEKFACSVVKFKPMIYIHLLVHFKEVGRFFQLLCGKVTRSSPKTSKKSLWRCWGKHGCKGSQMSMAQIRVLFRVIRDPQLLPTSSWWNSDTLLKAKWS